MSELCRIHSRESQEISIANRVSNVQEGLARGNDVTEDRRRLREAVIEYREQYHAMPPLICDNLSQLGVYVN